MSSAFTALSHPEIKNILMSLKMKILKKIHTIIAALVLVICISSANAQNVYFANNQNGAVQSSDFTGANLSTLLNGSTGLYGIAIDLSSGIMFYTNVLTNEIYKANVDGSSASVILNNSSNGVDGPRGIAVDESNKKIYWVENGSDKLRSANFDGSGVTDILSGLNAPVGISIDLINNQIYYSENGLGAKRIRRCNLDGSSVSDVVSGLDQVSGITVDLKNHKLFWVDFGTNKIMQSDLSGSNIVSLDSLTSGSARGITVDNSQNKIFWSDVLNNSVSIADINGSNESQILSGLNYPIGVNIDWTNALPVELVSFSAKTDGNLVMLKWSTSTEKNNYGFEVQRTIKNEQLKIQNWESIGFIPGYGSTNSVKKYSFQDKKAPSGKLEYRLKQIDLAGNYEYSNIINVKIDLPESFNLSQNYPNPFNPSTVINYSLPVESNISIVIYNTLGSEVKKLVSGVESAGNHNINFNASQLSSGIYYYSLIANSVDGKQNYKTVKKMLLLK